MNILWNPNPLCTVIELDDSDKRWLRERLKVEDLLERISEAHFDLDYDMQKWCNESLKRDPYPMTLEGYVKQAISRLNYDFLLGEAKSHDGKTWEEWIDQKFKWATEALADSHGGDCTCNPHSCHKCMIEELLGIDTTKGLGKYEAHHIAGCFRSGLSLEQTIEKLRDYKPEAKEDWMIPHLARWEEEGRKAFEWLTKYKAEHFS